MQGGQRGPPALLSVTSFRSLSVQGSGVGGAQGAQGAPWPQAPLAQEAHTLSWGQEGQVTNTP